MDIEDYINQIRESKTGAEMREPLANALTAIYEKGSNITSLNHKGADYYLKKQRFKEIASPLDVLPKDDQNGGSKKLVQSKGIYYDLFYSSTLEFTLPQV